MALEATQKAIRANIHINTRVIEIALTFEAVWRPAWPQMPPNGCYINIYMYTKVIKVIERHMLISHCPC